MCVYLHMRAHSCIGKSLMTFHLNINNNYQSEILTEFFQAPLGIGLTLRKAIFPITILLRRKVYLSQ